MLIELLVEVLAAAFSQSETHTEAENAADPCVHTVPEKPSDVLLCIIDERQDRG